MRASDGVCYFSKKIVLEIYTALICVTQPKMQGGSKEAAGLS